LENTGLQAALELFIPAESEYFDGHFPEFRLLSAVAQVDLVTWFASRCLGTSRYVSKIRRIKFSRIISPGARVRLEISYNKEQGLLGFKIVSPDRRISYSAGTLILGSSS
jgi:3-hydroxymyristoyl/3-hydroxydecanoyl-(acyl carrier protein) dehydratase